MADGGRFKPGAGRVVIYLDSLSYAAPVSELFDEAVVSRLLVDGGLIIVTSIFPLKIRLYF